MKKLTLLLCILSTQLGSAQIGMNQWRIHFSGFKPQGIAETSDNIYMACSNGIVRYDLEDNSINQLTVTNGISDLGISSIESDETTVVIGYVNGNLDIIEGNNVTNVPWIKTAELAGDKTIHNFFFDDNLIYVATGIGLILLDNERKEIKDTYNPYENPLVYDVTIHNDTIFAATENGIYFAPKNRPFLNDNAQWEKKTDLPVSIINGPFTEIESFDTKLFFAYNSTEFKEDTVYFIDNSSSALNYFEGNPVTIKSIQADDDRLIFSFFSTVQVLDENLESIEFIFDYPNAEGGAPAPEEAVYSNGFYWVADNNNGLVKAINSFAGESVFSNTPETDGSYRMDIQFGKALIAGGGLTANLQNNFFRNGVYLFTDEQWTNFNHKTQDSINFDKDWDFVSVAVNQSNTDEFAFGSFSQGGLKIVRDGENITEVYNASNSILEEDAGRIIVTDLKYDDNGNLWILNKGLEPLKVFTPDGRQYSWTLGAAAKDKVPFRLLIDDEGTKWVAVPNVGIVAFNEGDDFEDGSDDQWRTLSASEGFGNLPSIFVRGIAQDADGEIWIGTEEGLVVLYSRNRLFDGDFGEFDASPILLEVEGEVERLLGSTPVTAIAIDGGNRKWIGTNSSGVFCLSEDGTEEVYRFTAENSPLISNNILDIKVDQLSGEVYFATEAGLVSFRSDATLADNQFSNVTVFPNPVHPDFEGPISVQGLGFAADVKVTDISGNVVFQGVSNGGTFIWDGKTLAGERVQSGVYLVWSGITRGKGKNVAKILFIN